MIDDEFEKLWRKIREVEKSIKEYIEDEIRRGFKQIKEEIRTIESMIAPSWSHEGYLKPLHTVRDEGSHYTIYVDLPRADEGSVDVRYSENKILIRARLKESMDFGEWSARAGEIRFKEYKGIIELPIIIDPAKVRIIVKKGVLKIIVPKY